jgi:hypothetical protein
MFTKLPNELLNEFKIIYHQTTRYSNPIIESVLYQDRGNNGIFYFGKVTDGNYFIFHRSGFCHLNLQLSDSEIDTPLLEAIDSFLQNTDCVPKYLMFYNTPKQVQRYFEHSNKRFYKNRIRRRYTLDKNSFLSIDTRKYAVPINHALVPIQECSIGDLGMFKVGLDTKFYNSYEDFLDNSFGFVLFNHESKPVSLSYLICQVGRSTDCDLITFPEWRNYGYAYICITNFVRESIRRNVEVGWDCFVENHTNKWIQEYGYTEIVREYSFISYLNKI